MHPLADTRLLRGDAVEVLKTLPACSVDSIVTDPPYELGLHQYSWDATGVAHNVELWRECFRVLKPGGHLLAFGAPRTYHRLAVAIEDAGFDIRDSVHWIYGSGFPRGMDLAQALDRDRNDRDAVLRITRFLRDARDRVGLTNAAIDAHLGLRGMAGHWTTQASQPRIPTREQWDSLKTLLGFGDDMDEEHARLEARKGEPGAAWQAREVTGFHRKAAPDAAWKTRRRGRCSHERPRPCERRDVAASAVSRHWQGWNTTLKPAHEPIVLARRPLDRNVSNNVRRHGVGGLNIDGCRVTPRRIAHSAHADKYPFIAGLAADLRAQMARDAANAKKKGRWPANVVLSGEAARELDTSTTIGAQDERAGPGPSRFFFVAKPDATERDAGLARERQSNTHPTVKPITLMRHLVRLVNPRGGVVLDPFMGSGTTGVAAALERARFIGIEQDAEYIAIATSRINHWKETLASAA